MVCSVEKGEGAPFYATRERPAAHTERMDCRERRSGQTVSRTTRLYNPRFVLVALPPASASRAWLLNLHTTVSVLFTPECAAAYTDTGGSLGPARYRAVLDNPLYTLPVRAERRTRRGGS